MHMLSMIPVLLKANSFLSVDNANQKISPVRRIENIIRIDLYFFFRLLLITLIIYQQDQQIASFYVKILVIFK